MSMLNFVDPVNVTQSLVKHPAFIEATEDLRNNLELLCQRLKKSLPFSSFRNQVRLVNDKPFYIHQLIFQAYMMWDVGYHHSLQSWLHSSFVVQPEQCGQHGQWGDPPAGEGGS